MSALRVRIAFTKVEEAKYIAHLDLARVFERSLRRAGIRMAYSEGFNPHPKISFGSALAVGVEGEREYLDIEVAQDLRLKEILGRLQEQLPTGIRLLEGQIISLGTKALMAVLNAASYRITVAMGLPVTEERLQEAIDSWLARNEIQYLRFSKKGQVEKDIRPWVKQLEGHIEGDEAIFELEVEVGNQGSVRPEEVIGSLCDLEKLPLDLDILRTKRTGIYVSYEGQKFSPMEHEAFGK
ncbi:TIGR03936 family radical SAM-associated protein [Desulfitobacterium metallireducens]|uniref:Radical SAM protein n=1 Tax=Desulfitobacterium metallireducens DSM 15288 TaxID=871968 RepID=W0EFR5_9FIRM|nr:TIGR03936 family radical SAM-associated protein [Desulfitobacterium metallireducens]AHF07916.1 radical SAM protein [Desulfitobacterium metallireducens DSM 15288]